MSGLGGCLNCCSPIAKCPKDEVGNGRIMGFGGMGRMGGDGWVAVGWVFAWLRGGGGDGSWDVVLGPGRGGRGGAARKKRPPAGAGGRDLLIQQTC